MLCTNWLVCSLWGWKQCLYLQRPPAFWYRTLLDRPDFRCLYAGTICKAGTLTPQNWIHEAVRRNTLEMPAWSGWSRKALVAEGIVYGSLRGHVCKPGALQASQWRWVLQGMCSSSALKGEYVNTEKWVSKEAEVFSRLVPFSQQFWEVYLRPQQPSSSSTADILASSPLQIKLLSTVLLPSVVTTELLPRLPFPSQGPKRSKISLISLMFFLSWTVKTKCNKKRQIAILISKSTAVLFLEHKHKSTDLVACIAVFVKLKNTSNALTWCIMLHRASLLHDGTDQRNEIQLWWGMGKFWSLSNPKHLILTYKFNCLHSNA